MHPSPVETYNKPFLFVLCVDDFGIKYQGNKNAQHLLDALKDLYTIAIDWTGSTYCGLTIKWDYNRGYQNAKVY